MPRKLRIQIEYSTSYLVGQPRYGPSDSPIFCIQLHAAASTFSKARAGCPRLARAGGDVVISLTCQSYGLVPHVCNPQRGACAYHVP